MKEHPLACNNESCDRLITQYRGVWGCACCDRRHEKCPYREREIKVMPYWVVRDADGLRAALHANLNLSDLGGPSPEWERTGHGFATLEEAERGAALQAARHGACHIEPDEEEVLDEPKVLGYVWSINPDRPDFYAIKGGMGSAIIYESKEAALAAVRAVPNLTHSFLFALTLADEEPMRVVEVPKTYTLAPYVKCDDPTT